WAPWPVCETARARVVDPSELRSGHTLRDEIGTKRLGDDDDPRRVRVGPPLQSPRSPNEWSAFDERGRDSGVRQDVLKPEDPWPTAGASVQDHRCQRGE